MRSSTTRAEMPSTLLATVRRRLTFFFCVATDSTPVSPWTNANTAAPIRTMTMVLASTTTAQSTLVGSKLVVS